MLELNQVSKNYPDVCALERCDLSIASGQTTVLIGPSGCGKSTILRLIIGLQTPDEGSIHFAGQRLEQDSLPALRQRMGYVIQDGGLFPHLSARDNIALMARYLRWPDTRIASRITELADLTHFPVDALDRFPIQLSGGQQQRVSLMRSLMLDPEVLLLDEPLAGLNHIEARRLAGTIVELNRGGVSIILIEHNLGEVLRVCSRLVVLDNGRVLGDGAPEAVMADPAVRTAYLGAGAEAGAGHA